MKKKLTLIYGLILLVSLGTVFSSGIVLARNSLLNEAKTNVVSLTHAYKNGFDGDTTDLVVSNENIRETILLSDGSVLWDSKEDASTMENHSQREEVIAALSGNPTTVIRSSSTMGVEYLYYAETMTVNDTTYVIRVSLTTSSLTQFMTGYIPWMIIVTLISLCLAFIISALLSIKATEPIQSLENNLKRIQNGQKPEQLNEKDSDFIEITDSINKISASLSSTMNELKSEKEKLQLVLDNVQDPILALDNENRIIFENKAFQSLFPIHKETAPDKVLDLLNSEEKILSMNSRDYSLSITSNRNMSLLVFTDITETLANEKRRQEFFDASSHELKTPLTTIKGFNELISLKSNDTEIQKYSGNIEKETERMLSIIADMLKISALESKPKEEVEEIDLYPIANEVLSELTPLANDKKVSISILGKGKAKLSREDAYSLMKNLLENAILYNIDNGYARIRLNDNIIEVEDNGIGITKEDQDRIFERFYRVDKSRSHQLGGTGLGLSIVKHIVLHYNGKIKVDSRQGFGTTIQVTF